MHLESDPQSTAGSETDAESVDAHLRATIAMLKETPRRGPGGLPIAVIANGERPNDSSAKTPEWSRLGHMMVQRGLVTQDQLDKALAVQRSTGRRVGETLLEMGAIASVDLAEVLADHLGVPFMDLRTRLPDLMLAALIPEQIARRYDALPVANWSGQLVVAMANPNDVFALDDLRVLIGQPLIPALAEVEHLRAALDRAYQHTDVASSLADAETEYDDETHPLASISATEEAPMVRFVDALLEQAANDRASDLHIEPTDQKLVIRERIDGVLHDVSEAPLAVLRPMISRLKVLGGLDIAQTRIPQDGRFSVKMTGRVVDVRVGTVPTAAGEAMVLRMLDPRSGIIDLASLGFTAHELERFEPVFNAPQGAIFVTGPTGSGKTSTLYAVLSAINSRTKSIVSVEDPVEYHMSGIKQMQIHPKAGVTFPIALRATLRIDPDVIFIGEVRDAETARIAADASITGHLVLSTLHATSAAASPVRLIDMGIEPYLVASALTCVTAQRLVRTLCEQCSKPMQPRDAVDVLRDLGADDALRDQATLRVPVGCPTCRDTGYKGRAALFEIMPVTEGIGRLIVERAPTVDIERLAVEEGMDTLRVAALKRVARGELSPDEMLRVVA